MSAIIVNMSTIHALVSGMIEMKLIETSQAEATGQMLVTENYRSFIHCYGHRPWVAGLSIPTYEYQPHFIERISLHKQAEFFRFQACEHDGWETSRAEALTIGLMRILEAKGCDRESRAWSDAPWGLPA